MNTILLFIYINKYMFRIEEYKVSKSEQKRKGNKYGTNKKAI